MITHILHPWQDPETVELLVLPVEPTIPSGWHFNALDHEGEWLFSSIDSRDLKDALAGWHTWRRCPLGAPGERVAILEEWRLNKDHFDYEGDGWQAADTMPIERSRITLEVTSVGVKLVGEIEPREAWAAGARCICTKPVSTCGGNQRSFREKWRRYHPTHPWETSWAWFVGVRRIG
jgi:hypothetical protein